MMRLKSACIQTHNAALLSRFYAKVFGHDPFIDGGVDFQFAQEQLTIFLLEDRSIAPTERAALIYSVDDVDAEYARLNALGLCANAAPTNKPWGMRSFLIHDPDGNTVSFSQPL